MLGQMDSFMYIQIYSTGIYWELIRCEVLFQVTEMEQWTKQSPSPHRANILVRETGRKTDRKTNQRAKSAMKKTSIRVSPVA